MAWCNLAAGRVGVLTLAVVIAIGGCASTAPGPPGRSRSPGLVAYGHSYVAGVPGQPPPWPTVLASDLHLALVTVAHGGDVATRCLSRMLAAADHPVSGDVVVWECDLNDVRRFGSDPGHLEVFQRAFVTAMSRLAHGKVIVLEDPPIAGWGLYPPFNRGSIAALDAYNAVIERSAPPGVRVIKVLGWDPGSMLERDGVHPNDMGKRAIANTVGAAATA